MVNNEILFLVSGDSWEHEFDENDLGSSSIRSKSDNDSLIKSDQTITSKSFSGTREETRKGKRSITTNLPLIKRPTDSDTLCGEAPPKSLSIKLFQLRPPKEVASFFLSVPSPSSFPFITKT